MHLLVAFIAGGAGSPLDKHCVLIWFQFAGAERGADWRSDVGGSEYDGGEGPICCKYPFAKSIVCVW